MKNENIIGKERKKERKGVFLFIMLLSIIFVYYFVYDDGPLP